MNQWKFFTPMAVGRVAVALTLAGSCSAFAVDGAATPYPKMAPISQYLVTSKDAEIALARSAAPPSISQEAEIRTLGPHGYEVAAAGKNHFVCLVERSWATNFDSKDFWNPKLRAPHCFNAAAARSVMPTYLKRTDWVLAGVSREDMLARTKTALAAHEIPAPEPGAMAYMMSKDGYLNDDVHGPWHSHVMFYVPHGAPETWGANAKDSPVFGDDSSLEPVTVLFIPVAHWSDGTHEDMAAH